MEKMVVIVVTVLLICTSICVAETDCRKTTIINNKNGDLKFGQIINPPAGSDYSVWFPVVPTALAFDSKNNIYVGDSVNYRIMKFDKEGNFKLKYALQKPIRTKKPEISYIIQDIAVDKDDNVYIINLFEYRVEIYDPKGKFIRIIDYLKDSADTKHPNAKYKPSRITVDKNNNVYLYGPKFNLIYSANGQFFVKVDKKSFKSRDQEMVGFSGYYYDIKSYSPDPKNPGKLKDTIVIKDKDKKVVKKCENLNLEIAYDEEGKIYKADKDGNLYTFDYYDTLNVIKIFTNLK